MPASPESLGLQNAATLQGTRLRLTLQFMAAGTFDVALQRQERCLPVIMYHIEVLLVRVPAASLAALAESILLTASCVDISHSAAETCRAALHCMLMAQQPSMQAAWPLTSQRAVQLLIEQSLQSNHDARDSADLRDQRTPSGSPRNTSAPANSTAKSSGEKSRKRQTATERQMDSADHRFGGSPEAGSSKKKLRTELQVMEQAMPLQFSISQTISVEQLSAWSTHLTGAQKQGPGAERNTTGARSLASDAYSREQMIALQHLTSLFGYVRLIGQSRLPLAVSSGMVSLLLQVSQMLLSQASVWQQGCSSLPSDAPKPSYLQDSQVRAPGALQADHANSANALPAITQAAASCLSAMTALLACNRDAAQVLAELGSSFSRLLVAWLESITCWPRSKLSQLPVSRSAEGLDGSVEAYRAIAQVAQAVTSVWLTATGDRGQDAHNAEAVDGLMAWTASALQQVRHADRNFFWVACS